MTEYHGVIDFAAFRIPSLRQLVSHRELHRYLLHKQRDVAQKIDILAVQLAVDEADMLPRPLPRRNREISVLPA